ncbi:MAG: host-nuclease inhibitor Gam family protein [Clostridia bacterium]|nr:host-nuclease inhibitor Gam family protein [Clostridia bacterium]
MEYNSHVLEIINETLLEQGSEDEGFIIDNDNKAEWALRKISEERAETQRYVNVCKAMIEEYQEKIHRAEEALKNKTAFLETRLKQYFETVTHKTTKTQETYKLPGGTLKLKLQNPEFRRDEEQLLKWLKENAYNSFIKIEEKPDWAELKKSIIISGEIAVTGDGQVIEGVKVIEKPPVFEVET